MPKHIFQFKQFSVAQDKCAMKVGTDAVLLATLCELSHSQRILDIGTGTGVVALMLAQRTSAMIDAVEIEKDAAVQASENFLYSPWKERLTALNLSFEDYYSRSPAKIYDLIISNPPYFLDSLKTTSESKNKAKHAHPGYFDNWITGINKLLTDEGKFVVILPSKEAGLLTLRANLGGLHTQSVIHIYSFPDKPVKRMIITYSRKIAKPEERDFVIFSRPGAYSMQYKELVEDYFLKISGEI